VDASWRYFFEGIDFGAYLSKKGKEGPSEPSNLRIYELVQAFRRYGHLIAKFNPLQREEKRAKEIDLENLGFFDSEMKEEFATLGFCSNERAPLDEIVKALKEIYCGSVGFEFMDLGNPELEKWIESRLEPKLSIELNLDEKHLLLEYLNKSESFETFLHTKYVGQTRFSLEGAETMIPLIAEIIDYAGEMGVGEILIGMAHRGRLNVLTNILNKPLESILSEFEDDTTLSFSGNDDVKYHMGYTGEFLTRTQKKITVSVAANPSHLESVDPVVLGQTFAKQYLNQKNDKTKSFPLLIHGDASIAGQGVIYESLQLMKLPFYSVGGCIHLVVNNQIGYTTTPEEGRSTRYCTDIAKTFGCPVFHVNAEDPEGCLFAAKLSVEIRQKFGIDVFIDLYCYRKYGHNEGDEPSYTQPLYYEVIKSKKSIRQIYFEKLLQEGKLEQKLAETLEIGFKETMKKALLAAKEKRAGGMIENASLPRVFPESTATNVPQERLQSVLDTFCKIPPGFELHPKLQKWLMARQEALSKDIDWATAEALGFGTLLQEGAPIRLAGQDCQRGTFSQRHMVWIDSKRALPYSPFSSYSTSCQVINSHLSEFACMGFEYGYSLVATQGLNLWEAQYGDFNNGAEIIIDQYIVSGEQKWNSISNLTLLLPHGYEGAGPEHSSCRLERFLQLCANQNIQVVYPSTPAQYFHLLRRQVHRKMKRPLIVLTPKSLLRSPACVSKLDDFTKGEFHEILDDPNPPQKPKRLIFCTGKIFYELLAARQSADVAILRIEELYPLHIQKLKALLNKYQGFTECVWVQEEPENMGAWRFIGPFLQTLAPKLCYVGRAESATTGTGSNKKHKQEQALIITQAFGEL
jgi:2-oxoglutarate dehydrogenase E1 component